MKKILIMAAMMLAASSVGVSAASDVQVFVDGEKLETQYAPVIENDTTLIPMRDIFEALGAKIQWIDSEKAVMAYDGLNILKVTIDSDTMLVNSEEMKLNVPAKLIDEKTYVPLRAVSESLNAEVIWEEETRSIQINIPQSEHKLTKLFREETISDEMGNVLVDAYVTYPQFENVDNDEAIAKLNERYSEFADKQMNDIKTLYTPVVNEMRLLKIENNIEFEPVTLYFGYEITYDKFNKLSCVEQLTAGDGGTYQAIYLNTFNYDLDKNDVLEMNEVLNVIDKDFETLSVYTFYLYEDTIICCLNSDNMAYVNYGYEPSIALTYNEVTKDAFRFNPVTGEINEEAEPVQLFVYNEENGMDSENLPEDMQTEVSVREFKSVDLISEVMGFKMVEPPSLERYTPVIYEYIDGTIGQATYEDQNKDKLVLRKAEGDFILTERDTTTPVKERAIENSYVEFFDDGEACYAWFAIEKDGKIFSYSVELENREMLELEALCKNIIKLESK